jgi:alpha-ketoglutarate-dependent taurine dioxygenase|tara:strand:- start:504 stop:1433 length:930 start_codon:yes stop_codon:yes gene_type:complete
MVVPEFNGVPLSELDPDNIAKMVGKAGVVVIRNSGATPEEYAEWSLGVGYHLSPEIWCTDKEHSNLFWTVTNEMMDDRNQGLFGDYELDWHTNMTPVADAEEVIGLYAKTITYETETWFANSVPYFNQLPEEKQNLLKELTVVLDPKRTLGVIKKAWQPAFKKIYGQEVLDEINKNRNTREIVNCQNMEPENKSKFGASRGIMNNHKFVPDHPIGVEGLFFSPYEVHGFLKDGKPYEASEELFNELWNDYICNDRYIYQHTWQEGDICLFDNIIGIHRRPDILKDKPRKLLRTAKWYKSHMRKHHDYVV